MNEKKLTKAKAFVAAGGFLLAGTLGWGYLVEDYSVSLPLAVFYLILVVNTFFCVRLFSKITPSGNFIQNAFDAVLAVIYIATAASMGDIPRFVFLSLILFIVATAKYVFLLDVINYPKLLKRKILIDLCGVLALALTFGGIFFSVPNTTWLLAAAFLVANVFLLFVWPMYRIDGE